MLLFKIILKTCCAKSDLLFKIDIWFLTNCCIYPDDSFPKRNLSAFKSNFYRNQDLTTWKMGYLNFWERHHFFFTALSLTNPHSLPLPLFFWFSQCRGTLMMSYKRQKFLNALYWNWTFINYLVPIYVRKWLIISNMPCWRVVIWY